MPDLKIGFAAVATAVTLVGAACGGESGRSPNEPASVPVAASATRLRPLLAQAQVPVGRGTTPAAPSFPAAWRAFQRFARIPVDRRDLSGDEPNDDLRFEFGVFESNFWGTSFEVELTRQYGTASGDLHRFTSSCTFRWRPTSPSHATSGHTVPTRRRLHLQLFFAGNDALVPHPCRVVAQGTGGYRVGDMTLWASQAAGGDASAQRTHWVNGVESSPVFRAPLSSHVRPGPIRGLAGVGRVELECDSRDSSPMDCSAAVRDRCVFRVSPLPRVEPEQVTQVTTPVLATRVTCGFACRHAARGRSGAGWGDRAAFRASRRTRSSITFAERLSGYGDTGRPTSYSRCIARPPLSLGGGARAPPSQREPRAKSAISGGVAVSKPTTSSCPGSFGSAMATRSRPRRPLPAARRCPRRGGTRRAPAPGACHPPGLAVGEVDATVRARDLRPLRRETRLIRCR